jgi:hypothetical protein
MSVQSRPIRILYAGENRIPESLSLALSPVENEFLINSVPTVDDFKTRIKERLYHIYILHDSVGVAILNYLKEEDLIDTSVVYVFNSDELKKYRDRYKNFQPYIYKDITNQTLAGSLIADLLRGPFKAERIKTNLNLEIELIVDAANKLPFAEAAWQILSTMRLDNTLKLDKEALVDEFEDLLCRMFYNCESVRLELIGSGYSGASVLRVQPVRIVPEGTIKAAPSIFKFGVFEELNRECENYKLYVDGILTLGFAPRIQHHDRTIRLGGILYELVGNRDRQPFIDMSVAYHRYDIDKLSKVLRSVFHDTCDGWYKTDEEIYTVDLTVDYREKLRLNDMPRLALRTKEMPDVVEVDNDNIYFEELDIILPNPLIALEKRVFIRDTYRCVTHGDLHVHNILLNEQGASWLIDFSETGYAHILRDVASLEASMRIYLLNNTDATLSERYDLELALLKGESFEDFQHLTPPTKLSPILEKVFLCTCILRQIAAELVKGNPKSHLQEYYVGLFYQSLRALKYRNLSPLQLKHAFLSAALINRQLAI